MPLMNPWPLVARVLVPALTLLVLSPQARAVSCEDLRTSIEDRIRANGVQSFTVRVVEASASAPGRVVGSCDLGTRKIVYARSDGNTSAAAVNVSPKPSGRGRESIITECRDGRVITSGSCEK